MPNQTIHSITLPSGNTYDLKDAFARSEIQNIRTITSSVMSWGGTTTTAITDGSTTSTIVINGNTLNLGTDDAGLVVAVENSNREYAWNGSSWQEFGSTGSLKALAFKDSISYTPEGTVTSNFVGTQSNVTITATNNTSGNYQPAGSVQSTGNTNKTATVSAAQSGTTTYQPAGSITVTPTTTTIKSVTNVGSMPTFTATVANEVLTLGWTAGAVPTVSADTTVATGIDSSNTSFTGTPVRLVTGDIAVPSSFSFTGTKVQLAGTTTATGGVNSTFTGTAATLS